MTLSILSPGGSRFGLTPSPRQRRVFLVVPLRQWKGRRKEEKREAGTDFFSLLLLLPLRHTLQPIMKVDEKKEKRQRGKKVLMTVRPSVH